jgi:hypothetical protein
VLYLYVCLQNNHKQLKMSRTINYTTRTFYVPAEKLETLIKFQNKCKENGHRSYSEVILKLMEDYNDGQI